MSLRALHLFLIVLSIILAGFFSAWLFEKYRAEDQIAYALACLAVQAGGVGLAAYAVQFRRKTKNL